jgi:hypothetical protein
VTARLMQIASEGRKHGWIDAALERNACRISAALRCQRQRRREGAAARICAAFRRARLNDSDIRHAQGLHGCPSWGRMGDPAPLPHEPRAGPQGDRRRGFGRAAARRTGGGLLQLPGGKPIFAQKRPGPSMPSGRRSGTSAISSSLQSAKTTSPPPDMDSCSGA